MFHRPVVLPTIIASLFIVGVAMSLGVETEAPDTLVTSVVAPPETIQSATPIDGTAVLSSNVPPETSFVPDHVPDADRFAGLQEPEDRIRTLSPHPEYAGFEGSQSSGNTLLQEDEEFDFGRLESIEWMRAAAKETRGTLLSQLDVILLAHDANANTQVAQANMGVADDAQVVADLAVQQEKRTKIQVQSELEQPATPPIEHTDHVSNEFASIRKTADISTSIRPKGKLAIEAPGSTTVEEPKLVTAGKAEPQSPTSAEPAPPTTGKIEPFSTQHFRKLLSHSHAHKPAQTACVAELQLIAARTQIYFDTGSSSLDNRAVSAARLIAAKVQSCPEAQVSILGFTDPIGSKELNLKISWKRANSVFRTIEDAGFSMSNIEVSSHMEDHPDECLHYEGVDRRVIFSVRENAKGT